MLLRKAQDEAVDKTLAVQLMIRESSIRRFVAKN